MPGSVKGTYLKFLTAFSCLYALCLVAVVALSFAGIQLLPLPGGALGLALLPLLYHLVVFRFVVSRLGRRTAYIVGVALIYVALVYVSFMTGGYNSPNNIALAFLIFLSAMLGPEVTMALIWVQIIGYVFAISGFVPALQNTPLGIIFIAVFVAAGFTGWAVFRSYRVREDPMVERLRQTLHDEQLQSEAVIAAISDGVAIVNRHGIAIHANQRFLDILALEHHELIGKHYKDVVNTSVRIVSASVDAPRIGPNINRVMETGETVVIDNETVEYVDGRPSIDISLSIMPLKNDDDEVSAVMIITRDISHLMRLQRMKDALIATASHELRTPITVIAGYADLLLGLSAGDLTDKQRHYLERTKETTAHLTGMVNDMLDISRLESGQRENNPEEIDIVSFLQAMTEEQLGRFAGKQIPLQLDAQPGKVIADKSRLRQVIDSLLSNAYKFTPDAGEVVLSAEPKDGVIEIAVTDSGPGVDKEHQQTIFDKFTKLDTTGSYPGAGLGLAIAKTIVGAWGGKIGVEEVSPHGARFYFTVPIASEAHKHPVETKKKEHA